ncbi:MAG: sigma-B regulation protein RsbU (phosphoserine phosphatase) [Aureispira sp.]|jgi:sigma-B regulation protein RsbU (phosphoserine phosphatase)
MTKQKWHKSNKVRYFFAGALFGICFPVMAVSIDIIRLGLSFSSKNILWVQFEFPIHLIINTAPLFLGLFALIGGVRQDKIEVLNKQLSDKIDSQKKELVLSSENLKETENIKQRMETELSVAKDIQLSMLPLVFPPFPCREDINIYADLIPAREVGGDFYDFFFLDEDTLVFVVGDVSGKGVPAALMMAVCKTLLKSKASTELSTAKIVTHVNNEMAKQNENYMFVTVFIAILNTRTGELVYTNAGHNPTLIKKSNGELIKLKDLHGPVVAAMEGLTYKETRLKIDTGDVIFAYTDGITEAHSPSNELFSDQRLEDLLTDHAFESSKSTVKRIIKAVNDFEAEADPFDDITALCIQFIGSDHVAVYAAKVVVKNKVSDIQVAASQFETFAESHQIPTKRRQQVALLFEELLPNIINDNDTPEHVIDLKIRYNGEKIIIILSDNGIPFNPFEKMAPDTELTINESALNELGIHIVKKIMDDYSYKNND